MIGGGGLVHSLLPSLFLSCQTSSNITPCLALPLPFPSSPAVLVSGGSIFCPGLSLLPLPFSLATCVSLVLLPKPSYFILCPFFLTCVAFTPFAFALYMPSQLPCPSLYTCTFPVMHTWPFVAPFYYIFYKLCEAVSLVHTHLFLLLGWTGAFDFLWLFSILPFHCWPSFFLHILGLTWFALWQLSFLLRSHFCYVSSLHTHFLVGFSWPCGWTGVSFLSHTHIK